MRQPGRVPGRSAGLLFCGVALQILLAVLCDAASADSPLGVAERDAGNSLSDENPQLVTVASRAAERDADKNLRDEENIDEDNDTNHGGTLPPAAGESLRARAFPTVLLSPVWTTRYPCLMHRSPVRRTDCHVCWSLGAPPQASTTGATGTRPHP